MTGSPHAQSACRCFAKEFPFNSVFSINGEILYLIGYTENDMLIVSPVNPSKNYDEAISAKRHICASHLRAGT
jgi:hypothetical protein